MDACRSPDVLEPSYEAVCQIQGQRPDEAIGSDFYQDDFE